MTERIRKEKLVLSAVSEIRRIDPGIGGYKLWLMAKDMFGEGWVPGRDRFYHLLAANDLRLSKPKPRTTTNSNHRYHKYKNLIKGFVPTSSNQLWVSDITYVALCDGCCYLHIVTDAYSHKIVGWCLAETLQAVFTLEALRMAIRQTGKTDLLGLIHHSDRGAQYCCNAYTDLLRSHNISISMTEDYNPTDNGIAERVNGIIKTEYIYRRPVFKDMVDALRQVEAYIGFYNHRRPHMSIGYKTPAVAHQEQGLQKKMLEEKRCIQKKGTTFAEPNG